MRNRGLIFLTLTMGTLPGGAAIAAPVAYVVTVDSSAVSGTSGFLHFQFNGGSPPFLPAKAQILDFKITGGAPGAVNSTNGEVAGALPNTVKFGNSTPLNELYQAVHFGTKFSFIVILSGPAVDSPNPASASGSTFGVGIYDSGGNPILTNDPSGYAGEVHVNVNGTTTPVALPSNANGGPSVVTLALTELPRDRIALVTGWELFDQTTVSQYAWAKWSKAWMLSASLRTTVTL